jgi:hypothetical protein
MKYRFLVASTATLSITFSLCAYTPHNSTLSFHQNQVAEAQACARQGNSLCLQELSVINKRNERAVQTLSSFLGTPVSVQQVPLIGFSGSGGGIRASIATLGVLKGLEDIGLLGAVHYMAGVSGSIWTLATWFITTQRSAILNRFLSTIFRTLSILNEIN